MPDNWREYHPVQVFFSLSEAVLIAVVSARCLIDGSPEAGIADIQVVISLIIL